MSTGASPTTIVDARTIEEPDANACMANFHRNIMHVLGVPGGPAMQISGNNNEVSL